MLGHWAIKFDLGELGQLGHWAGLCHYNRAGSFGQLGRVELRGPAPWKAPAAREIQSDSNLALSRIARRAVSVTKRAWSQLKIELCG